MENVFLGVIAFNALLTVVIVGGLAFGMRLVNRKLDQLETEVEQEVMPKLRDLARITARVADATAEARRRTAHAESVVRARSDRVHRLVGRTLDRVAGVADRAAGVAGQLEADEDDETAVSGVRR